MSDDEAEQYKKIMLTRYPKIFEEEKLRRWITRRVQE